METENATPEGVEPELTLDEAKAVVATKVHPKVTEASIKARIADVTYMTVGGAAIGTICLITLKNGWTSLGFSAPASPENFDTKVGERYAFDNAFKPLWQLEGYLLRDRLYEEQKKLPFQDVAIVPTPTE